MTAPSAALGDPAGYAVAPTETTGASGFYDVGSAENVTITPITLQGSAVEALSADVNDDYVYERFYAGSEGLAVDVAGVAAGDSVLVRLVSAADASRIVYIDQKMGNGDPVSFKVLPVLSADEALILKLTSDGPQAVLAEIPLFYAYSAPGETHYIAPGFAVSGTVLSWNSSDDAKYLLYDSSVSDADVRADALLQTPAQALDFVADLETPSSSGNQYAQTFRFDVVTPGSYKLAVVKPGKYVPKVVSVTVDGDNVDLGELKLWLYGDVNGDGRINAKDITQLARYISHNRAFDPDPLACANVNRDASVNAKDITQLARFISHNSSKMDEIP